MPSFFTASERTMLANMPENDIVELAAELSVSVPETIQREELMQKVMSEGPEAAGALMEDPELREMLQKVQDLTNRN